MSDSDYTLLEQSLLFGGVVSRSVDLETGEVVAPVESAEDWSGATPAQSSGGARSLLSTLHISPFVEWASGAGLLKVSKGEKGKAPKGGKRGKITAFSFASRRRLMRTIAKIKLDAELPCFVTLTYPNKFPSPIESKKHLDIFNKRLCRAFPNCGFIWKLEPQKRGAPHYHLLVWGCDEKLLSDFVPVAWHEIAGGGDEVHLMFHLGQLGNEHCVSQVRSRKGVMRYAEKYLGKTFEVAGWDEVYPGRFWSVVQKENIPFGQDMVMYITQKDAHVWMRYQRKFSKVKKLLRPSSFTIFCDAEQWVENILEVSKSK